MNREDILGPWKLKSMGGKNEAGEVYYPYGETPSGMILYDSSGYMSYTAMRRDRPRFKSGDFRNGTPEEIAAAYSGFDAYCGHYAVDMEKGVVIHHLEACKSPNWEGSAQVRHFQISGNPLLIDSVPISAKGHSWVFHVVFERPA